MKGKSFFVESTCCSRPQKRLARKLAAKEKMSKTSGPKEAEVTQTGKRKPLLNILNSGELTLKRMRNERKRKNHNTIKLTNGQLGFSRPIKNKQNQSTSIKIRTARDDQVEGFLPTGDTIAKIIQYDKQVKSNQSSIAMTELCNMLIATKPT